MEYNAFIVDWTMHGFPSLKQKLERMGFAYQKADDSECITAAVPYDRWLEFAGLCQIHLNSETNYVDLQYREQKTTILIFQEEIIEVHNDEENQRAKSWAISAGLPPEQAEWAVSY